MHLFRFSMAASLGMADRQPTLRQTSVINPKVSVVCAAPDLISVMMPNVEICHAGTKTSSIAECDLPALAASNS